MAGCGPGGEGEALDVPCSAFEPNYPEMEHYQYIPEALFPGPTPRGTVDRFRQSVDQMIDARASSCALNKVDSNELAFIADGEGERQLNAFITEAARHYLHTKDEYDSRVWHDYWLSLTHLMDPDHSSVGDDGIVRARVEFGYAYVYADRTSGGGGNTQLPVDYEGFGTYDLVFSPKTLNGKDIGLNGVGDINTGVLTSMVKVGDGNPVDGRAEEGAEFPENFIDIDRDWELLGAVGHQTRDDWVHSEFARIVSGVVNARVDDGSMSPLSDAELGYVAEGSGADDLERFVRVAYVQLNEFRQQASRSSYPDPGVPMLKLVGEKQGVNVRDGGSLEMSVTYSLMALDSISGNELGPIDLNRPTFTVEFVPRVFNIGGRGLEGMVAVKFQEETVRPPQG
jgi:hypothetical protein